MSLPKALLYVGVFLCFTMAGQRIYEFYYDNIPVAKEGQCVDLNVGFKIKGQIKKNDWKDHSSTVYISLGGVGFELKMTFGELRKLEAKKVDCEEIPMD